MELMLVFGLVWGGVCAAIASSKGRTPVGWFFAGFAIGLIGLIIILCMSNLKEEEAERRRHQQERRRLQEQVRQERLKGESFRRHTYDRLDAHDRVLGVNTREPAHLSGGAGGVGPPQELPTRAGAGEARSSATAEWFYESRGTTQGPVSRAELEDLIVDGRVSRNTLVWTEGMGDWLAAGSLRDLAAAFRS